MYWSDTLKYMDYLNKNKTTISNLIQGKFGQNEVKDYEGKLFLPLFSYADEHENNNRLETHRGIAKYLGVYASVPCLPHQYL